MSKVISRTISHNTRALHTLFKLVLKIIIIRSLTCATTGMIESVVTLAPANVQQTKALVLKCCRVGRTHWLLVRRAVVITNTTGIKCRESFADGMVIASNVCTRVYIFRAKKTTRTKSALVWISNWPDVLHPLRAQLRFNFFKFCFVFPGEKIYGKKDRK